MGFPFLSVLNFSNALSDSIAIRSQGKFQKQILLQNAELAKFQADDAIKRGNLEANQNNQQVKKLIGSQRAAMAAQGIDLSSGSALDIQQSTAELGAIDSLTIKNNAWREAWGYKVDSANYQSQAKFTDLQSKYKSRQTLINGGLQALGSGIFQSGTQTNKTGQQG